MQYEPVIFISFSVSEIREALEENDNTELAALSDSAIHAALLYSQRKGFNIWHDNGEIDLDELERIALTLKA